MENPISYMVMINSILNAWNRVPIEIAIGNDAKNNKPMEINIWIIGISSKNIRIKYVPNTNREIPATA